MDERSDKLEAGEILPEKAALPETQDGEARNPVPAFSASPGELAAAALLYPLAYLYIHVFWYGSSHLYSRVFLALFVLGFVLLGELLHRRTARPWESWIWLGCLVVVLGAYLSGRCRVWEDAAVLFLHIFGVWWLLARSGTLAEGESGTFLPLDAMNGFLFYPFRYFFLRFRVLWFFLTRPLRKWSRGSSGTLGWSLAALFVGGWLLYQAAKLLAEADVGFSALFTGLLDRLTLDWSLLLSTDQGLILLLSFPVGAYLFGLLAGTDRVDRDVLRKLTSDWRHSLEALRRVPGTVWAALTGLFCLLYLLFFAVQFSYLFGGFVGRLPEGFIVSEYARQGFFELCRVMAVNFVLLWLSGHSVRKGERGERAVKLLSLLLLGESLLLAAVAFSKLYLYISCFGFTPRRLQSTWLVCLLAFGCLCWAVSLWKGKKTFRVWMFFGAVSLSLLCLY